MNKMNKKGFTLIEMLVVIAIIAILVSIIVPVVGNSTVKAAAATNAANLRSVAATVAIKHLENPVKVKAGTYEASGTKNTQLKLGNEADSVSLEIPAAKAVKVDTVDVTKETKMKVVISGDKVTATYGNVTIEQFANIADDGKLN